MPQTPRNIQINNDDTSILTETQKRKRQCDLLVIAGEGGYSAPCLPHLTGQTPPVAERPPPPYQHPQPQASDAVLDAAVRAALAATPGAERAAAPSGQQETASPDVAIVGERSTIVLREPEALTSREQVLEVVGDIITAYVAETSVKKKKDHCLGPKTRASTIKKVQVKLTKKKITQEEQKYLQEVKRHEKYRKQVREFRKVQEQVAEARGEPSKKAEANADEIPQLKIRDITTVRQENPESFEEICEGDILHLKEELELVINE